MRLSFVEANAPFDIGVSLVDSHLLATLPPSPADRLWTRDRRLRMSAGELGVLADLPG